jgi:hypothetical protein
MLKQAGEDEGRAELEEAINTMLMIVKHVNDVLHQISITGYDVSICDSCFRSRGFQTDTRSSHCQLRTMSHCSPARSCHVTYSPSRKHLGAFSTISFQTIGGLRMCIFQARSYADFVVRRSLSQKCRVKVN